MNSIPSRSEFTESRLQKLSMASLIHLIEGQKKNRKEIFLWRLFYWLTNLVKFSLVRHQRWKLTVTGNDVNWSITWGQIMDWYRHRLARGRGEKEKISEIIKVVCKYYLRMFFRAKKILRLRRLLAACSPPNPPPIPGAGPAQWSCTWVFF